MAFMHPVAERFAAYHVETTRGTEIIPQETVGHLLSVNGQFFAGARRILSPCCEGEILSLDGIERKEGWYGRLSAPGYLDCTEWDGPHATAQEALDAVKETFDVDDNGDDFAEGPSSERAP